METAATGALAARERYERRRASHLHDVRAALEDHVGRLAWSRAAIGHHRTERLRGLLAHARACSPFHAARLEGLDLEHATEADLARLPPMTKGEAQTEWDAIAAVPDLDRAGAERILAEEAWFSYTRGGDQVFSSGGSTGVRGVYVWDWHQFVALACLAWRMQARAERRSGRTGAGALLGVLTAGEPPHASTPLFDVATATGMQTVVVPAAAPFDEVLAAVAACRPTHLVGYASVIGRLARATLAGDLELCPVRVSTNSEPLTAEDRDAIARAWDAPVHNLWGSTEIGVQAVGCGAGEGLHICEDEVILERVDADGRPVAADEPAVRTLATGLAGRSFPFIRYDLGDEVALLTEPCPCGSGLVRVADVEGRSDDDFHYGDRAIPAVAFRHVLGTDPRVTEYQVHQTAGGAEVLCVGSPDTGALGDALIAELRRHGLPAPRIEVRAVERLERNAATGKLRRFVPLG